MDNTTTVIIKKTSSGLGFMLFAAAASMAFLAGVIYILIPNQIDNAALIMIEMFISIISLFLVGIFYCWFSKTNLNYVISVKSVKLSLAVPLIIIALTVSLTADYLTDLLQSSFSLFGIENGVNLDTSSPTLLESILNIISVSIIPPLVEEFLFRGILLGKLRHFGDSFALFLSSALFGLMHGNIIQIPFAFIVGLGLAFITIKCGSIVPAMIVHFLVNFRSVILSILLENKIVNEDLLSNIYLVFIIVLFVLAIFCAAKLSKKKDFFKLESKDDIPFRYAMRSSILSVGMIFFVVNSVLEMMGTLSISWLNFNSFLS